MVPEDLTEIERVKVLLTKEDEDQRTYFFNNIEDVCLVKKLDFQNVYGPEYDEEKQRKKAIKHNYETQPRFQASWKSEMQIGQGARIAEDAQAAENQAKEANLQAR